MRYLLLCVVLCGCADESEPVAGPAPLANDMPPPALLASTEEVLTEPWEVDYFDISMGQSYGGFPQIQVTASIVLPPETDVYSFSGNLTVTLNGKSHTDLCGHNLPEHVAEGIVLPSDRGNSSAAIFITYDDTNELHRDLRHVLPGDDDVTVEFELIEWRAAD